MTGQSQVEPAGKKLLREVYRQVCGVQTVINLGLPRKNSLRVNYGGARSGNIGGPLVKVRRLREYFPEERWRYSLVYLLSNAPYLPAYALKALKRGGIPIVYNQNGVFYPAWFGGDWRAENARMSLAYHAADYVFYQSKYCQRCADSFLGVRSGAGEILYNAVDTRLFAPLKDSEPTSRPFTFLVTGKFGNHLSYRLKSTIEGLAGARREGLEARLVIAGWIEAGARADVESLVEKHALKDMVSVTGPYTQNEAPNVYRSADAYVMLKHQDPCPNTVLEALACGLPVLYSATGGVPELVGIDAGLALPCAESFEAPLVPSEQDIAHGMLQIASRSQSMAKVARQRAVDRFDIEHWIARHRAIFERLAAG